MQEPLVLLPGMMCDGRLFAPQIAAFSHQRAVLTVPLTGSDTMEGLADAVLRLAPPQFALAGLSMGGIVAMEILRQAPGRVSRLALLDTNPLADPPEKAPIREAQVRAVLSGGLRSVMRDEMKPNYLTDGPNRDAILALCMQMAEDLGPQVFATQSRAIQNRPDQSATLRAVTVPTLVLCGEDDRLCPPERHRLMRDLVDGARLSIIKGAGHLPTLEQPDDTNRMLQEWLTH
ncbi:alpha/beta fold hydrolase [Cognatishimia sp. F0-27]|uniref:alpha/beta fold hydrolase n=1 Tax=Cognatishimia sp. F0-27 TaxID=2816855 RepID=UPI001D0C8F71|nr:alpha/beta fold hydrolase [Cognatishimia sp. F0-27]MCC1494631.1 alpha/beta fold hydrolase [Cognatishimia sp. F0-27]